jgi:hypothetical protein
MYIYLMTSTAAVVGVIEAWRPVGCSQEAARVAREVVARCRPKGPSRARALLWSCSALAEWAITVGMDLRPSSLLSEATIERHVATAMTEATDSSRRTRRANLRFMARTLGLRLLPEPPPISRSGPALPYSRAEIDAYLSLAHHQPSSRRRVLESMIGLGAGAGLDGHDMRYVTGDDVIWRSGGLLVVVGQGRERTVPVMQQYRQLVAVCAACAGKAYMVGGLSPVRKNVTTPVLERTRGGAHLERLSVARLRSTWLSHQLEAIGFHGLMAAAGLKSSQRLFELAAALEPLAEDELVSLLGGTS